MDSHGGGEARRDHLGGDGDRMDPNGGLVLEGALWWGWS
jgi:hypothetical protein